MPFKQQVTSITNELSPAEILQLQTSLSRISQAGREASVLLGQNMQGQSPYNQRAHRAQIDALLWDSYTLQHFGDIIASEYKYCGTRALENLRGEVWLKNRTTLTSLKGLKLCLEKGHMITFRPLIMK